MTSNFFVTSTDVLYRVGFSYLSISIFRLFDGSVRKLLSFTLLLVVLGNLSSAHIFADKVARKDTVGEYITQRKK